MVKSEAKRSTKESKNALMRISELKKEEFMEEIRSKDKRRVEKKEKSAREWKGFNRAILSRLVQKKKKCMYEEDWL